MSAIYGFTYGKLNTASGILSDTLGALEYWNRIYGREDHGSRLFSASGIGCYVEHFSDAFSYGGPILERGGCCAVVDALLYNREELIMALGLSDDAVSDEVLLLQWIETKGFDALAQVNGDFAGAIYDPEKEEWTLFRDHMGVRPLYYYLDKNLFAFSTDLRALAAIPCADLKLNEMQFYLQVCGTNSLTLLETDFHYIRCVLPAAVTRVRKGVSRFDLNEQVYWKLCRKKIRLSSDEAYQQELRRLITDAVHRRCDAIPGLLGAEFSGGLDSTVIDITLTRYGRDAHFFSWSPDLGSLPITENADERRTVLEICEKEHMTCHFMEREDIVSYASLGEHLLPPYIDTVQLGFGSAWLRRQGARVVFTGHGGDEGVSHRGRRYELVRYREYGSYFRYFRQDLAGKPLSFLRALRAGLKEARASRRAYAASPAYVRSFTELFQEEFAYRMDKQFVPQEFTFQYDPHLFVMQGGTRPRMDNAAYQGAFHSVRYLFPYVDYRVMDFALSIPRSQFVGQDITRKVFREAFRDMLPDMLYKRNYKYQVSTKEQSEAPPDLKRYHEQVEKLIAQLDAEYWSQYIDLAKLRALLMESDGSAGGIGSIDTLMDYLYRCTLIQDVQKNAKRWREFDEQDKTV